MSARMPAGKDAAGILFLTLPLFPTRERRETRQGVRVKFDLNQSRSRESVIFGGRPLTRVSQ